ncbi:MAG TPA: NADPH:quinone oxidoreductase family protein [Candidatus Dormibacteraeota bacterium]|jgi:NADPH2:quinone reductase
MRAWRAHELGEAADVLHLDEVEVPKPGPGEVLIEVEAAGLNFPDVLLLRGQYQERPPLPFTPGLEVAGRVVATGAGSRLTAGQRVVAVASPPRGGLAEQVCVAAADVLPLPDGMSSLTAAAMLITYQTGYLALHRRAQLRPGENLLVHGGAGGVGSAAIQLGCAAGARVIATATGAERAEACRRLGADVTVDNTAADFVEVVKEVTRGRGADVVYDPVGGDVFDRSRRCVAFEGRILVIGFTGGRIPEVPAGHVLVKNYAVVGVHWGLYRRLLPHVVPDIHEHLVDLHREGLIDPLIGAELSFEEAPLGITMLAERRALGKIVVVR